jgi:hypothetical protein
MPATSKIIRTDETYQVVRRADGAFAYKPDRAPLVAGEMLIGRGLGADEALSLIEEFNRAATHTPRRHV